MFVFEGPGFVMTGYATSGASMFALDYGRFSLFVLCTLWGRKGRDDEETLRDEGLFASPHHCPSND